MLTLLCQDSLAQCFCAISGCGALALPLEPLSSDSISTKLSASLVVWIAGVIAFTSTFNLNNPLTMGDHAGIFAITHKFMQHTDNSCKQAHHKLNAQCASVPTNVSTALSTQQDIHSLVKTKVTENMSDEIAVQQKLCVLFNRSMIPKWQTCNPDSCVVKMNFDDTQFAFNDAVSANNSCLQIKMNINSIHFKPNFVANNIVHLSSEPLFPTPETPMPKTTTQPPIAPEQMIQTFLEQLSGS